jgi:hypothetical protein
MDKLTSTQSEQLWKLLLDSYNRTSLEQMLWFRLSKDLEDLVNEGSFRNMVFELIKVAEEEDWTGDLISAARESRPRNGPLIAFSQQFGLAPAGLPAFSADGPLVAGLPSNTKLEAIIGMSNRFLNVMPWLERLGEITGQVCRVDIKGDGAGTGFLVGPDVVMTNYHVVEKAITGAGGIKPADVTVRFDFKMLNDGTTINSGAVFELAANDWLVDSSPYHPREPSGDMGAELPKPDQLDYALLRTAGRPGESAIGKNVPPPVGERPRGWLRVKRDYPFDTGTPLFIVQHPLTAPLKLALETDGVIGMNGNKTRVNYRTNTEHGSSGSPVFDQDWDLVALHHGFEAGQNQGVPFGAIAGLLNERGLASVLAA